MASKIILGLIYSMLALHFGNGLNLGLISGDLKRFTSPIVIKKNARHSPVTINFNSGLPKILSLPKILIPPLLPSKLPAKPYPLKTKIKPPLSKRLHKLPRIPKLPKLLKLPKVPKLPKIRKLPLLPLLPPLIPPILPKLPKLPFLPLLPILPPPLLPLPKLPKLLKPGRIGLKALGSEVIPVKVPVPDLKKHILTKLMKLKKDGSLTAAEFRRFKKIIL